MSNNIEGKVIVITGASSGLGETTARLLSEEGATVGLGPRMRCRKSNDAILWNALSPEAGCTNLNT